MTRGWWRRSSATWAPGTTRRPDRRRQGLPGPYTYEPCDDVDPTPDYENVLTD